MKTENIRAREKALRALADFANMGDALKDWRHFRKLHPNFLPSYYALEAEAWDPLNTGEPPVQTVKRFLRKVWQGEDHNGKLLAWLLGFYDGLRGVPPASALSPRMGEWVESVLNGTSKHSTFVEAPENPKARAVWESWKESTTSPVRLNWAKSALEYVPRTEGQFQSALWNLFQSSWRAKVCPQCGSYFVAVRTAQRFCSTDCRDIVNREIKLQYWREIGKARRELKREERKQKTRKGGKEKT